MGEWPMIEELLLEDNELRVDELKEREAELMFPGCMACLLMSGVKLRPRFVFISNGFLGSVLRLRLKVDKEERTMHLWIE